MIDVASAIITLDGEAAENHPENYFFTVNEAIQRYRDLRPQSIANDGQVRESIDAMTGLPLDMTRLVKDARSWDEKTYALTGSPLWNVVLAYEVALKEQFHGAVDLSV